MAKLLSQSPYLSRTVGQLVAQVSGLFSIRSKFNILAVNPDILSDQNIINYVTSDKLPMPDSLLNILDSLKLVSTSRTAIEYGLSQAGVDMHAIARIKIDSIISDTLGINHAAIRDWLDSLQEPEADMMFADDLMGEGRYSDADNYLKDKQSTYKRMDDYQLASFSSYYDLITHLSSVQSSGLRFDSLLHNQGDSAIATADTTHNAQWGNIKLIADQGTGPAALRAKNYLRFFYGVGYEDLPASPDQSSGKGMSYIPRTSIKPKPAPVNQLKLFPNPAQD